MRHEGEDGQVDVGSFLLACTDLDGAWQAGYRVHERTTDGLRKKVTEDDLNFGQGRERVQIRFLISWAAGVPMPADARGEVLDAGDVVVRSQDLLRHLLDVEPLERRALESTVIEVEPVDAERSPRHLVQARTRRPKKARAASRRTGS
jgi:hypothetical protein